MFKCSLFSILFYIVATTGNAQTPFISESLIKYDLNTHKTDKPIPFDRSFTLVLEKFKTIGVKDVHLYEAMMFNGNRFLVENIHDTLPGRNSSCCKIFKGKYLKGRKHLDSSQTHDAIVDKVLRFKSDSAGLMIFVDPLQPNKLFDINVSGTLSADNNALINQLNSFLSIGNTLKAQTTFMTLDKALTDPSLFRTNLSLDFAGYQTFFYSKLKTDYDFIADEANFPVTNFITLDELRAIDISLKSEKQNYKDSHFLVEVIQNRYENDVQRGLIDLAQVFTQKNKPATALGHIRILYLQSSLKMLDSLHRKTDWLIDKGYDVVMVGGNTITLELLRQKIKYLRDGMAENLRLLTERMKTVLSAVDANSDIRQGIYLAGQTVSSDLKTAGGSILFVDAGLTNIVAPGLKNVSTYIPRLYYGVSIYFRPIDKNTRRSSFPGKFSPAKNCGCLTDTDCGPDYGAITKATIWQHLCLNVGLTLGVIPNKDFENFYNNTSLLVGPAYRFKRAFKISAGITLLKRSSENPIISEKQVIVGQYVSLSVDLDFIQGIKDITSILFK